MAQQAQQFVFEYVHNKEGKNQILPEHFEEHFKSKNNMIYLTGNDRNRYKSELMKVDNRWVLWDNEWEEFVAANVPRKTKQMHFIKQGVDDYYVTVYEKNGSECVGYDRTIVGPRLVRCTTTCLPGVTLLPDCFLEDIWQQHLLLKYENMTFRVKVTREEYTMFRVLKYIGLSGCGWSDFLVTTNIKWGNRLAFTNIDRSTLSVVALGDNGVGISREDIRTTLIRRPSRRVLYRDRHDVRMAHLCNWPFHGDHVSEENVFYCLFCAEETEESTMSLNSEFFNIHMIHDFKLAYIVHVNVTYPMTVEIMYDKKNIMRIEKVTMKGRWSEFGQVCGFRQDEMMRWKLVRTIPEYVGGEQVQVPVFHVC